MISEDDEKRYGLRPLPEVKVVGLDEARRLNEKYVKDRIEYRRQNPHITKDDIENGGIREETPGNGPNRLLRWLLSLVKWPRKSKSVD